jgi:hypothetical protein
MNTLLHVQHISINNTGQSPDKCGMEEIPLYDSMSHFYNSIETSPTIFNLKMVTEKFAETL